MVKIYLISLFLTFVYSAPVNSPRDNIDNNPNSFSFMDDNGDDSFSSYSNPSNQINQYWNEPEYRTLNDPKFSYFHDENYGLRPSFINDDDMDTSHIENNLDTNMATTKTNYLLPEFKIKDEAMDIDTKPCFAGDGMCNSAVYPVSHLKTGMSTSYPQSNPRLSKFVVTNDSPSSSLADFTDSAGVRYGYDGGFNVKRSHGTVTTDIHSTNESIRNEKRTASSYKKRPLQSS